MHREARMAPLSSSRACRGRDRSIVRTSEQPCLAAPCSCCAMSLTPTERSVRKSARTMMSERHREGFAAPRNADFGPELATGTDRSLGQGWRENNSYEHLNGGLSLGELSKPAADVFDIRNVLRTAQAWRVDERTDNRWSWVKGGTPLLSCQVGEGGG